MKNLLLSTALLALVFGAKAQRTHLVTGDEFYEQRMYLEAIQEYKKALDEDIVVKKYYMTRQVAETYKMLFDYENAEIWFAKLLALKDERTEDFVYLHYAQILANNEKYDESAVAYSTYATKNEKANAAIYAKYMDWAKTYKDSIKELNIYETNIETGTRSIGLALYNDGIIYSKPQIQDFTTHTAFYDLAYAKKNDSITFSNGTVLAGATNHSFYEGAPSLTSDENTMFYTANASTITKYRPRKLKKLGLSSNGLNILKIYQATKNKAGWNNVKELSFNSNEYDCTFPHITRDGKSLYFVSNMPGGYGGFDVYRSDRVNDTSWSKPINLGPEINSDQDEMYPYVYHDSLFYSSKGKKGFGGADIYVSVIENGLYSPIENIGKPYNSSKDDFAFVGYEEDKLLKGYISSNRAGTHGYDHIYYFEQIPKPVFPDTISGVAINRITEHAIPGVKIELVKITPSGEEIALNDETGNDGAIELILDKNIPYRVKFTADGYEPKTIEIPATDRDDVLAEFGDLGFVPEVKKDVVIEIDNIYFDYDKATIRPQSFPILENIVKYLNMYPEIRVELSAHTDARGSDRYNLKLSDRRARSTVEYLLNKGIDKSRLVPKGYGETKLKNHCKNGVKCSDGDHEQNRRVELKVL